MKDLLRTLEKESESAVDWFKHNHIMTNPGKFQFIILNKSKKEIVQKLKICHKEIEETNSLALLDVKGTLMQIFEGLYICFCSYINNTLKISHS